MSLSQVVAHEMVNKCVKFLNISFNSVEAMIKNKKSLSLKRGIILLIYRTELCPLVRL